MGIQHRAGQISDCSNRLLHTEEAQARVDQHGAIRANQQIRNDLFEMTKLSNSESPGGEFLNFKPILGAAWSHVFIELKFLLQRRCGDPYLFSKQIDIEIANPKGKIAADSVKAKASPCHFSNRVFL